MNQFEARGKAYFIAARLIEAIAQHMPDAFQQAAELLEVSQAEMDVVKQEMNNAVVDHLTEKAMEYRKLAMQRRGGKP